MVRLTSRQSINELAAVVYEELDSAAAQFQGAQSQRPSVRFLFI